MSTLDRLPPLDALRVFDTVARLRSFTAAGEALALSTSAVSRAVRQLEDRLGLRLLERNSRSVLPTAAGAELAAVAERALGSIAEVCAQLTAPARERALLVSCERSLGMRWLIPRLPGYQARHPGVPVFLSSGGGGVAFGSGGPHLAIRRADFHLDPALQVTPLGRERMGPVAAPQVWRALARGQRLVRLHSGTRGGAWAAWQKAQRPAPRLGSSRARPADQHFDHFFLTLQAAEAGLGVAMASQWMVQEALSDGRLQAPHGFVPDGSRYVALHPAEGAAGAAHPALPGFIAWLQAEAAPFAA
jgi:DNA-binding transcriptional LysR family regulator